MLKFYEHNPTGTHSWILLPGGPGDIPAWKSKLEFFPDYYRLICPGYPGRGNSDPVADNSIKSLVKHLNQFIDEKIDRNQSFSILGNSFGSVMAFELFRNPQIQQRLDRLVLICFGEYLVKAAQLLKTIFQPAVDNNQLQKIYGEIAEHSNLIDNFNNYDLRSLDEQLLAILDYRLPKDFFTNFPAEIYFMTADKIIDPDSQAKVREIFPTADYYFLDHGHMLDQHLWQEIILQIGLKHY